MAKEEYLSDVRNRYVHGELGNADSVLTKGDKAYKTPAGKILYGGGGIYPDVYIPIDTNDYSLFYARIVSEGVLSEFIYTWTDKHKNKLKTIKSLDRFMSDFKVEKAMLEELIAIAGKKGIHSTMVDLKKSSSSIKIQIKALIARQYFGNMGYYRVQQELDRGLLKSIDLLKAN
jgi:carboxyl-terminal processing protease